MPVTSKLWNALGVLVAVGLIIALIFIGTWFIHFVWERAAGLMGVLRSSAADRIAICIILAAIIQVTFRRK